MRNNPLIGFRYAIIHIETWSAVGSLRLNTVGAVN
jgi:hypothetical protein